jgi:hypothetical protein
MRDDRETLRTELLGQHERLREQIRLIDGLGKRLARGKSKAVATELRAALRVLMAQTETHVTYEESVLSPILATLDAPMSARLQHARALGRTLCVVGRLEFQGDKVSHASVGLRDLPSIHPLSGGIGTDNRVAIHSCRYRGQPLLIQGPGAGADITAAALLDDVARIARRGDADSARDHLDGWQSRQVGVEGLGPVDRKSLGVVDTQRR